MSAVDMDMDREVGTVMVSFDEERTLYDYYGYHGLRPSQDGMRQMRQSRPGRSVIFVPWDDLDTKWEQVDYPYNNSVGTTLHRTLYRRKA